MATITIPCYPNDKVMFPAYHEDAQEWRENTLFYQDFKIAERFGVGAIKDTFKRAFSEWKTSAKYMCELTVVTNRLLWEHHGKGENAIAKLYHKFYEKCCALIYKADKDGNNIGPFTDDEVCMIYKVLD